MSVDVMKLSSSDQTPTPAQKSALLWLRNRNADGVFDLNGVLLAAGELAPVTRATWNRLSALGLVETYAKRRLRVTAAGLAIELRAVVESQPAYDEEEDA